MIKTVEYKGRNIKVRDSYFWLDVMNSCFYTVIDEIKGYKICQDNKWDKDGHLIGEVFALPDYR